MISAIPPLPPERLPEPGAPGRSCGEQQPLRLATAGLAHLYLSLSQFGQRRRLVGELTGENHLHGDNAVEPRLPCLVDHPHPILGGLPSGRRGQIEVE